MSPYTCSGVLFGVGAFLVAFSAVATVYWPSIYFQQLKRQLVVTNESMSFDLWRETPIPMFLEVHLWNLSNVHEVLANSNVKPHFNQMGPYVFRETHIKTNLSWHPENNTVTYYNNRTWHFVPDMSNGTLNDNVTNVNPVVVTTAYTMRQESVLVRPIVNALLLSLHEHMFVTAPVREWMFDGIDDPVIHWAVENDLPIGIPYDRFGWFYERNGSETFDGSFNMDTGAADIMKLGNIARWNGVSHTSFFRDACAEVRGSSGELWAPELMQDERTIFASDLCTYMTLHRERDISVSGISGVRYVANNSVFDNGYRYPQMECYCQNPNTTECPLPGALNVSSCRFGAPALVSFPHFYLADPYYLDKVDGLRPNKEEHEFFMGLEVFTGIPLEVRAQLQINLLVRRVTGMSIANVLPEDTAVPMFWFRQEVLITDEFASQARLALLARFGVLYFFYALAALGVCVLCIATVLLLRRLLCVREETPLLTPDSEPSTAADGE